MGIRCMVCATADAGHRKACGPCVDTLRRRLREIDTYRDVLPHVIEPVRRGLPVRGAPGYGSRSPARDDVLVVLDPRSKGDALGPDDSDDPFVSLPSGVYWIANGVRHELQPNVPIPLRRTIWGELTYVIGHLDQIVMRDWVEHFANLVRILHTQARALAGDRPPQSLGNCLTVGCGAPVYPATIKINDEVLDGARCSAPHRREYIGRELMHLSAQAK